MLARFKKGAKVFDIMNCLALQPRHLSGAYQRVHRLSARRNLDPFHHHLLARGLLRDGK